MSDFGFIITRHVNSEKTNKYWNQSVKLIRTFYPNLPIVIIDDNSNQQFVSSEFEYKNITIIQSEYPRRGELLPFIYYLKYKWFSNAVILHDSLFIHKRIPFEKFKMPVLPLWHHPYDRENQNHLINLTSKLLNNHSLINKLDGDKIISKMSIHNKHNFDLCFGGQCYIKLNFLESIQNKYRITNLINVILNRRDRCALERILGVIFCEEYPNLLLFKSMFGDITTKKRAFNYTYDNYITDLNNKIVIHPFIKVWTGR